MTAPLTDIIRRIDEEVGLLVGAKIAEDEWQVIVRALGASHAKVHEGLRMTLLAYNELCELVGRGVITNVQPDQINAASIDLTLGGTILCEKVDERSGKAPIIDYSKREPLPSCAHPMTEIGYLLLPGQFILAQTEQVFHLPCDISGEYKLKSSMARIGLEHLNAGWCDAGWNGSVLTLELKNMTQHHAIRLRAGDRIGQIVFFKHAPVAADRSYATRGRYNGDKAVSGVKA